MSDADGSWGAGRAQSKALSTLDRLVRETTAQHQQELAAASGTPPDPALKSIHATEIGELKLLAEAIDTRDVIGIVSLCCGFWARKCRLARECESEKSRAQTHESRSSRLGPPAELPDLRELLDIHPAQYPLFTSEERENIRKYGEVLEAHRRAISAGSYAQLCAVSSQLQSQCANLMRSALGTRRDAPVVGAPTDRGAVASQIISDRLAEARRYLVRLSNGLSHSDKCEWVHDVSPDNRTLWKMEQMMLYDMQPPDTLESVRAAFAKVPGAEVTLFDTDGVVLAGPACEAAKPPRVIVHRRIPQQALASWTTRLRELVQEIRGATLPSARDALAAAKERLWSAQVHSISHSASNETAAGTTQELRWASDDAARRVKRLEASLVEHERLLQSLLNGDVTSVVGLAEEHIKSAETTHSMERLAHVCREVPAGTSLEDFARMCGVAASDVIAFREGNQQLAYVPTFVARPSLTEMEQELKSEYEECCRRYPASRPHVEILQHLHALRNGDSATLSAMLLARRRGTAESETKEPLAARVRQLEEEVQEAHATIASQATDTLQLRTSAETTFAASRAALEEKEMLQKENDEMKATVSRVQKNVEELQKTREQLMRQLEQREKDVLDVGSEAVKLQQRLATFEQTMEQRDLKEKELLLQMEAARSKADACQRRIEALESKLASTEKAKQESDAKLSLCEKELSGSKLATQKLEEANRAAVGQLQKREKEVGSLGADVTRLRSELESAQVQRRERETAHLATIAQLEEDRRNLQRRLTDDSKKVSEVAQQAEERERKAASSASVQVQELRTQLSNSETVNVRLQERIKTLEGEIASVEKAKKGVAAKYDDLQRVLHEGGRAVLKRFALPAGTSLEQFLSSKGIKLSDCIPERSMDGTVVAVYVPEIVTRADILEEEKNMKDAIEEEQRMGGALQWRRVLLENCFTALQCGDCAALACYVRQCHPPASDKETLTQESVDDSKLPSESTTIVDAMNASDDDASYMSTVTRKKLQLLREEVVHARHKTDKYKSLYEQTLSDESMQNAQQAIEQAKADFEKRTMALESSRETLESELKAAKTAADMALHQKEAELAMAVASKKKLLEERDSTLRNFEKQLQQQRESNNRQVSQLSSELAAAKALAEHLSKELEGSDT